MKSRSDWLLKRGYLAWNRTCAWSDIADVIRKQKLLLSWKQNATRVTKISPLKWTNLLKECLPNFELKFEFLENLRKPLILTRLDLSASWTTSWNCTYVVYSLCDFTVSYAIQEKFTAWRVNSTLNFTRKTAIARIAKRWVRCRFFKWNLTWNSFVRQWIFLESHS